MRIPYNQITLEELHRIFWGYECEFLCDEQVVVIHENDDTELIKEMYR